MRTMLALFDRLAVLPSDLPKTRSILLLGELRILLLKMDDLLTVGDLPDDHAK